MIYHNLMDLVQKHADDITTELIHDIRSLQETRLYSELSDDILSDRIHQVLYNVYKRLSNWLHNHTSKNVVFAYYTGLGRERFREEIPLDEVVQALFLIKKKIFRYISENRTIDNGYSLNQITELFSYVNLFFDKIIHAVIIGYQEESALRACV